MIIEQITLTAFRQHTRLLGSEQLMDPVTSKILPLGDDVAVYSGHGPETTLGRERRTNPFLTGRYF